MAQSHNTQLCGAADRLACDIAVDAFGGVGGNSVQLARSCKMTIVTDINMERLLLAKHNAVVYDVATKLDFVCGDFLKMAPHFQVFYTLICKAILLYLGI